MFPNVNTGARNVVVDKQSGGKRPQKKVSSREAASKEAASKEAGGML